jgi:glycosyltransferase involved in cell wall biosynthesis
LGLPLLEAQFAGLPIVASDQPVFREVLDDSGIFIRTDDAAGSADIIRTLISAPQWRQRCAEASTRNVARWNDIARRDLCSVRTIFAKQHDRRIANTAIEGPA